MSIKIISVNSNFSDYGALVQKLESDVEYPFGSDFFKLDHGDDYFAFFKRLGLIQFNLAIYKSEVVGCAAGVLRKIKFGNNSQKCWYLCDLKVRKDFLGKRIPSKLLRKKLFLNYLLCGRGYAISMNPAQGENRVVRLLKKFSWLPFHHVDNLNFYTLSYKQVLDISNSLSEEFRSKGFLSLEGKKDLVMKSNGQRLPLLHFQYGPFAEAGSGPVVDASHMFCAPNGSSLDNFLSKKFEVQATASVVAHRMSGVNWDFILSSDI